MALRPPTNDPPVNEDGQHSEAWSGFFDDLAQAVGREGITNGSNAVGGSIGEVVQSVSATPILAASAATVNATSINLTAGDWEVYGEAWVHPTGAMGLCACGIGTVSATLPGLASNASRVSQDFTHANNALQIIPLAPCRQNIVANTTIYLTVSPTGSPTYAYGKLVARRVR